MAEFDNSNRFVIFREENRKSEQHPEYTGSLNIDGVEYWLSAWVKTSQAGKKFFSGSVRPKEANRSAPKAQPKKAEEPAFDDDIPF